MVELLEIEKGYGSFKSTCVPLLLNLLVICGQAPRSPFELLDHVESTSLLSLFLLLLYLYNVSILVTALTLQVCC